jgi:hypothetical protein
MELLITRHDGVILHVGATSERHINTTPLAFHDVATQVGQT